MAERGRRTGRSRAAFGEAAGSERAIEVRPLTREGWDDLVALFDTNATTRNCACMYWRVTGREFDEGWRERRNQAALHALVDAGTPVGLLAYDDGRPVGWIGLGPRSDFRRLEKSRSRKPVDDLHVWSIVCFYVSRKARGRGVTKALVEAAVDYARRQGAPALEAYPIDPEGRPVHDMSAYVGTLAMFQDAGFTVVRATPRQTFGSNVVVRRDLGEGQPAGDRSAG